VAAGAGVTRSRHAGRDLVPRSRDSLDHRQKLQRLRRYSFSTGA
jgi:hypothetical protein